MQRFIAGCIVGTIACYVVLMFLPNGSQTEVIQPESQDLTKMTSMSLELNAVYSPRAFDIWFGDPRIILSGSSISTSSRNHEAIYETAEKVRDILAQKGFEADLTQAADSPMNHQLGYINTSSTQRCILHEKSMITGDFPVNVTDRVSTVTLFCTHLE